MNASCLSIHPGALCLLLKDRKMPASFWIPSRPRNNTHARNAVCGSWCQCVTPQHLCMCVRVCVCVSWCACVRACDSVHMYWSTWHIKGPAKGRTNMRHPSSKRRRFFQRHIKRPRSAILSAIALLNGFWHPPIHRASVPSKSTRPPHLRSCLTALSGKVCITLSHLQSSRWDIRGGGDCFCFPWAIFGCRCSM